MIDTLFDMEFDKFKQSVESLIRVDLHQYKPAQMKRRIKAFIGKYNIKRLSEFLNEMKVDEKLLKEFKDYITINVTEFFRNPEKFDELKSKIIPLIIENSQKKSHLPVRIWSAGCSTGAEVYTISIIMKEYFPKVDYTILATDIDLNILKTAKTGEYKELEVKNLNKYLLDKYFSQNGDKNKWLIKEDFKSNIKFAVSDLLKDAFTSGFDLILCRNVVIYFTEEAKDNLYKKFYNALNDGGVLFIGGTESILNAKQIGFQSNNNLFYFK